MISNINYNLKKINYNLKYELQVEYKSQVK